MANPTDPPAGPFHAELDDGEIIEAGGSTIRDPASGADAPAVVLRMSPARAHVLAHVLDDWCRAALVFATLRSSEVTERALAWTLEAGAAAAGDLQQRERRITPIQRIAVVDSAARWLAEDAGEELARALLEAVCTESTTASFVYLALIDRPGPDQ
jgi:hypothetical protein